MTPKKENRLPINPGIIVLVSFFSVLALMAVVGIVVGLLQ